MFQAWLSASLASVKSRSLDNKRNVSIRRVAVTLCSGESVHAVTTGELFAPYLSDAYCKLVLRLTRSRNSLQRSHTLRLYRLLLNPKGICKARCRTSMMRTRCESALAHKIDRIGGPLIIFAYVHAMESILDYWYL